MYAQFCPKLKDYKSCNNGVVCPATTPSPILVKSKYNTMDRQLCPNYDIIEGPQCKYLIKAWIILKRYHISKQ